MIDLKLMRSRCEKGYGGLESRDVLAIIDRCEAAEAALDEHQKLLDPVREEFNEPASMLDTIVFLRDERDRLKAEAAFDCHKGPGTTEPGCGACVTCLHRVLEKTEAERDKLMQEARSLAFEEAARQVELDSDDEAVIVHMPSSLRALAKLPPSLVAVEREVLKKVLDELGHALGDGHNLKAFAGTMLRWNTPGVDWSDEARRVVEHATSWHQRVCVVLAAIEGVLKEGPR